MLYKTSNRNTFCDEWMERNGEDGADLYAKHQPLRWKLKEGKIIGPKGPTGTDYLAYLAREGLESKMYKMTDRSLYGARAPFVKVYKKEEKFDGFVHCSHGSVRCILLHCLTLTRLFVSYISMSEDELARRLGMTLMSNTTVSVPSLRSLSTASAARVLSSHRCSPFAAQTPQECSCDRFETVSHFFVLSSTYFWRYHLFVLFLS